MYELIQLSEHDYYIDCPAKIGLVQISDTAAVAIDSGSDKDAGKKVLRHLEAKGWRLSAIFNTHSHADHIGGNKLLQDRTGCRVFAPGLELAYTNRPELEAMTLWGGLPFKNLQSKFLLAQPSTAEPLSQSVLPAGMDIVPLPGHSFDMVGYRTPDGNVFLADCLSSEETLQKYGIGYLWDPAAYVETLERVEKMQAECFVPAHAPAARNIAPLARRNIEAVQETENRILTFLSAPSTFEELLQKLFFAYDLTMTAEQYALLGSTVRSYLSSLLTRGQITFTFADNRMLFQRA